jgi:hypothetical protein
MPLPTRRRGESEDDFVNRFLQDEKAKEEFPVNAQRLAVALQSLSKGTCLSDPTRVSCSSEMEFSKSIKVEKVDEALGVVFGFAMVSTVDGEPFYDSQGDYIPEDAMMKASLRFMEGDRVAKAMHQGEPIGQIVFAFPLTTEVAKMLEIQSSRTGLLIGMKPEEDVLKKFADGVFTGFSIGGSYVETETT